MKFMKILLKYFSNKDRMKISLRFIGNNVEYA